MDHDALVILSVTKNLGLELKGYDEFCFYPRFFAPLRSAQNDKGGVSLRFILEHSEGMTKGNIKKNT